MSLPFVQRASPLILAPQDLFCSLFPPLGTAGIIWLTREPVMSIELGVAYYDNEAFLNFLSAC